MALPFASYKSTALREALAGWLAQRLGSTFQVVKSADAGDGAFQAVPTIYVAPSADNVAAPTAGHANFAIKILPEPWPTATDALGLPANVYAQHVVRLITEADPTGGAGADPFTRDALAKVFGQIIMMGTIVEWYETAAATAPTFAADPNEATPGTASLKTTWSPDPYRPLISAQ